MISANNVSLEGVDYATAVQVLRDSGQTVNLVVKRRVVLPPAAAPPVPLQTASALQPPLQNAPPTSLPNGPAPQNNNVIKVGLSRAKKKEDFGVILGKRLANCHRSLLMLDVLLLCGSILD